MSSFPTTTFNTKFDLYQFMVGLFTLDKQSPEWDKKQNSIILLSDSITEIKITTDISSPVVTAELIVTDRVGYLADFVNKTSVFCEIFFGLAGDSVNSENPAKDSTKSFEHVFCVDSINLLSHNQTSDTFKINLVSINSLLLSQNIQINFSEPTPILEILRKIIGSINLDLYVPEKLETLMDPTKDTTNKLKFISTVDDTALSLISYAVSNGFNINLGPIFCTWDLIKNRIILSSKTAFADSYNVSPEKDGEKALRTMGYLPGNGIPLYERMLINGIKIINFTPITKLQYKTRPINNIEFDFENGYWRRNKLDTKTILDNSVRENVIDNTTFINKFSEWRINGFPLFIAENVPELNYESTIVLAKENFAEVLFETTTKLFLDCNVVSVELNEGHVTRTPGDPFLIAASTEDNSRQSSKMTAGPWTVIRVTHIIKPNEAKYSNTLLLARNETVKSLNSVQPEDMVH